MRCDMEELITKITTNKLDKRTVVSFALLGGLPDCRRINTRDYFGVVDSTHAAVDTTLAYNKYDKPENLIECDNADPCLNTGGLAVGAATNYVVYQLPFDGTKFSSGIVILYVKGFTGAKNVTIELSDAATFANSDLYAISVTGKGAEYVPVVIDLTKTPTSVAGNGWAASQNGNFMTVNVADANAVISTISIFDSIEDFENNDTVQMGCLTTIEGEDAIDAAEATCVNPNAKHDLSSYPTFERTITGTKVTENYPKLNPLNGKGTATKAYILTTQKFTVEAAGDFGAVTLADAYKDECGFITVDAGCNLLKRYDIPAELMVDEDHFIVSPQENGVKIMMNQNLVGHEVVITYPREAEVTETVADLDNVDVVVKRTKLYVPYTLSNGKKMAKVYGNVLVTSFTDNLGEDDSEFSVTVSIQRAADGHYYHIYEYK